MAVPGGIVVVIVAVLVVVATAGGGGGGGSGASAGPARQPAPAAVAAAVTGVPTSVFDQVGVLQGLTAPKAIPNGTPLTSGGKPRVLYLGDEWCPVCATERWPMVVALSRFGTFTNLKVTKSSDTDSDPATPTLSFVGSTYTSPYLTFDAVEHQDRYQKDVMPLTSADQNIESSLGASGVPFIDFAGKWYLNTASYNPGVLQGLTWQQIAADLTAPNDSQGRAVQEGIVGSANQLSAVLCRITGGQPGAVCSSAGVKAAAASLSG